MEQPKSLSACVIGSFAYKTVKDRLPVILTCVIDYLCREKLSIVVKYGEAATEELKAVIARLSQLKNEMQTNKALTPFSLMEPSPMHDDTSSWNEALAAYTAENGTDPHWFTAPWLLVECYLYKRIHYSLQLTSRLCFLDPFHSNKAASLSQSVEAVQLLQLHCLALHSMLPGDAEEEVITALLQLSVWGNQCDLSISGGSVVPVGLTRTEDAPSATRPEGDTQTDAMQEDSNPCRNANNSNNNISSSRNETTNNSHCSSTVVAPQPPSTTTNDGDDTNIRGVAVRALQSWLTLASSRMLVDDSERVVHTLQAMRGDDRHVALVLDNAGYELLTDVCLSLCLLRAGLTSAVHVYVKTRPWFVSDTLTPDVQYTLDWLDREGFTELGGLWRNAIDSGKWRLREHKYWTEPHDFVTMQRHCPSLYQELSQAKMVIFKGDLNYRKLVSDRDWPPETPFRVALGPSLPSMCPALLALRTVKGGPAVGVDREALARAVREVGEEEWNTSGLCGMVQLVTG